VNPLEANTLKRLAKAELTEEQVKKVKELAAEYAPKLAAARKKGVDALPPEVRKARAEAMNKAKEAGKKPSEVVTAFKLTPEQQEAMNIAQKEAKEIQGAFNKAVMALLTDQQRKAIKKAQGEKKPKKKPAA